MAIVVLLRGVNVGGHKTFRPALLAKQLQHLDAVNIGAAGTFVIRKPAGRTQLRTELRRALPFETEVILCEGREVLRALVQNPFAHEPPQSDVVRFVSVLARRPADAPATPIRFPPAGKWMLEVVARDGRFVFGRYRRQMQAIRYLGALDRLFGCPVTTRNWNTLEAIAEVLGRP
jgi:uncharacterized protein (DUF1697 family)